MAALQSTSLSVFRTPSSASAKHHRHRCTPTYRPLVGARSAIYASPNGGVFAKATSSSESSGINDNESKHRREILQGMIMGTGLCLASESFIPQTAAAASGDWSSPGLNAPEDPTMPKFAKLDSGVRYQILSEGNPTTKAAELGDTVVFDYVLRRDNGYFIYATVEGVSFQPKDLPIGPVDLKLGTGDVVPGLEEAIVGMQAGGRRRILVPPSLGYDEALKVGPMPPGFAARRQVINHRRESLIFEVELLKVRPA